MLGGGRALGRELRHVVVPLGVLKLLGRGARGGAHPEQRQLTPWVPCCRQPAPHTPLPAAPTGSPTPRTHPPLQGPQNPTLPAHSPACIPTADPLPQDGPGQPPAPHRPGTPSHYLAAPPRQPPAPESRPGEQVGDGEHRALPSPASWCCQPHRCRTPRPAGHGQRPAPAKRPYITGAGTRVGSLFPSGVARCCGRCGTVIQQPSVSPPSA